MTVDELNALDHASATRELLRCCGSRRWADAMADARPFAGLDAMTQKADELWTSLAPADWREAFEAHPQIGASGADLPAWSRDEQSGVTDGARARLSALNREYEERFGHIFIVCAAGRSGTGILHDLERRLGNDFEKELREAAEEQRKITRLRLGKLMT